MSSCDGCSHCGSAVDVLENSPANQIIETPVSEDETSDEEFVKVWAIMRMPKDVLTFVRVKSTKNRYFRVNWHNYDNNVIVKSLSVRVVFNSEENREVVVQTK